MNRKSTYMLLGSLSLLIAVWLFFLVRGEEKMSVSRDLPDRFFKVQSIDTMKHSRDLAREKLSDPSFDTVIDRQMQAIRKSGATHVAIGTPYDDEFAPMLDRWVLAARRHGLSVWFRGNFSGWEGWFGYERIGPEEHRRLLGLFLEKRSHLFRSGDVFSPCPECENGGPGDPRSNGGADTYVELLADEYRMASDAFKAAGIGISVFPSMNADIAREVITPDSARKIGDAVLVDHYVKTSEKFSSDVSDIQSQFDIPVGIGEFGAPIPDIHGNMSESDQARFVRESLEGLIGSDEEISIVNYWVLQGGSTALLDPNGSPRMAYISLSNYYSPRIIDGRVKDGSGDGISDTTISAEGSEAAATTLEDGSYRLIAPRHTEHLIFEKEGYESKLVALGEATSSVDIALEKIPSPSLWQRIFGL